MREIMRYFSVQKGLFYTLRVHFFGKSKIELLREITRILFCERNKNSEKGLIAACERNEKSKSGFFHLYSQSVVACFKLGSH